MLFLFVILLLDAGQAFEECCAVGEYLAEEHCSDNSTFFATCESRSYRKIFTGHINDEQICRAVDTSEHNREVIYYVCDVFSYESMEEDPSFSIITLYTYCFMISNFFLLLTFITYCFIPTLRDLQGKCVMCLVASIFTSFSSLVLANQGKLYELSHEGCVSLAFLTYYSFMCVFFWLNNISFNIWRQTNSSSKWPDQKLWVQYLMLGFGGPLLLLTVTLITHHIPGDHIKPLFGLRSCWFSGRTEVWVFFYGPISILLLCNIFFYILTVLKLWKDYRTTEPQLQIRVLRFKCILYVKLFLMMGISWVFEIISFLIGDTWLALDIFNCLQGLIIFILMVATRKKVIRVLINSYPLKDCFPNHWQTMVDEESLQDDTQDQYQLN